MARRAYATEDKEARRRVILAAAADLFSKNKELPSVAEVAEAAGLAKGTVYLYFRTKGGIFADILLEGWAVVIDQLGAAFRPAEVSQADRVAAFLAGFVRYLNENPMLLQLDAIVQVLVERDLDPEERAAFKAALYHRITVGGGVVDDALGLAPGRGVQLLVRTHALTRGLWAYFDGSGAGSAPGVSDFAKDLDQALTEYWRGALTPAQPDQKR
jgi:AcrR family transcriptional regulator